MKAWHWLAACLAVLLVAGVLWNRYGRQEIRFATDAEIRAVVPANLLTTIPRTPDAVRRFGRLVDLCNRFKLSRRDGFLIAEPDPATIAYNTAIADSAVKLVRQGVAASTPMGQVRNNTGLIVLTDVLDQEAKLKGRNGDSLACERALADAIDVGPEVNSPGGDSVAYSNALSALSQATDVATFCVRNRWLKAPDLRALIHALPDEGSAVNGLAQALRNDLQTKLFDPDDGLNAIAHRLSEPSDDPGESLDGAGNFDVLQTAKLMASLYEELIASSSRPWKSQGNSVANKIGKELSELPPFPASPGSHTTIPDRFESIKYRMEMNAISNSIALPALNADAAVGDAIRENSLRSANRLAVFRLLAAMWAYREDHGGAFSRNLDEVVKDGYLPRVPIDVSTGKPLVYNAAAHTITAAEDGAGSSFTQDIRPLFKPVPVVH